MQGKGALQRLMRALRSAKMPQASRQDWRWEQARVNTNSPNPLQNLIRGSLQAREQLWRALRNKGPGTVQFWLVALFIGVASGIAAVLFRLSIAALQRALYGVEDVHRLHSYAQSLAWYWVVLIPTLGGVVVGLVLNRFTDDGAVRSVADVIEGAALHEGRVEIREGVASALVSLITLSSGGSSGREGPVVHMAAVISSWVAERLHANGITGRELLGCGVAAAVSASFNAPIAGALFAHEVVLRHFAIRTFAPVAIASVAGTVINRLEFGNITEFVLPAEQAFRFYVELPAFLLLGIYSAFIAVVLMKSIFWADDFGTWVQERLSIPSWLRPAIAGTLLGIIAIGYPHIIGVGYETTSAALTGQLALKAAIVFTAVKVVAVAITMAGRMGGGIFSPSLMVGALSGLAFGYVATMLSPIGSGSQTLYALAGMGAVAAAVLGAPISTALIIFELTGDWQTGLAVMVAVSISTAISSRMVDRSFFLTQLERRGVHLAAGPQSYLLATVDIARIMRPLDDPHAPPEEACWEMIEQGTYIDANATLERAMPLFEKANLDYIPVISLTGEDTPPELWGVLFQVDALREFNRRLAETTAEEHS